MKVMIFSNSVVIQKRLSCLINQLPLSQMLLNVVNSRNCTVFPRTVYGIYSLFDKAIAIKPDFANAWHGRGHVLNDIGYYSEAVEAYDKAIAINPNDPDRRYNRGISLSKLGQYSDAVASYDKVLTLKPGYADTWHLRGICFSKLGQYSEAIASFEKAFAIEPDHSEANKILD